MINYEKSIGEHIHNFKLNGYTHLDGLLDSTSCEAMVSELFNLVSQNKTQNDSQCPLSEAVYGAPVFDSILEQLLPKFELATGKKLLPTYSYARLYKNNEELRPHTDRPSCEISATLTIGFDSDSPWGFFIGDYTDDENSKKFITQQEEIKYITNISKLEMLPGDAVLYSGMNKPHWREKFSGQWHAQVFLHYVDADGPYKNFIFDGRQMLSHHNKVSESLYLNIENFASPEMCKKIIERCESVPTKKALIGQGVGVLDKNIRDVGNNTLNLFQGIAPALLGATMQLNSQCWRFNITRANQCDYLKYDNNGHYKTHIDTLIDSTAQETRKLTTLLYLNDDFEGGKFYLKVGDEKIYPPQKAGTLLCFPSFLSHGVEPVTSGTRHSIVSWAVGPWFV